MFHFIYFYKTIIKKRTIEKWTTQQKKIKKYLKFEFSALENNRTDEEIFVDKQDTN